jgi:hypothetical protein
VDGAVLLFFFFFFFFFFFCFFFFFLPTHSRPAFVLLLSYCTQAWRFQSSSVFFPEVPQAAAPASRPSLPVLPAALHPMAANLWEYRDATSGLVAKLRLDGAPRERHGFPAVYAVSAMRLQLAQPSLKGSSFDRVASICDTRARVAALVFPTVPWAQAHRHLSTFLRRKKYVASWAERTVRQFNDQKNRWAAEQQFPPGTRVPLIFAIGRAQLHGTPGGRHPPIKALIRELSSRAIVLLVRETLCGGWLLYI